MKASILLSKHRNELGTEVYDQVFSLLSEAIEILTNALPEAHSDVPAMHDTLGALYLEKRHNREYFLMECEHEEIFGLERLFSNDESEIKTIEREYQESLEKAEMFFKQSMEIRNQVLPKNHPDHAISWNNLAILEKEKGCDPCGFYDEALKIRKKSLPENHIDTAGSLEVLGYCHLNQGDYTSAENLFRESLKILEKALPIDHPKIESLKSTIEIYL